MGTNTLNVSCYKSQILAHEMHKRKENSKMEQVFNSNTTNL